MGVRVGVDPDGLWHTPTGALPWLKLTNFSAVGDDQKETKS